MPSRRVQGVFKTCLQKVFKTCLQVLRRLHRNNFSPFKTSSRRLSRCLQDFSRRLQDVLQDIFKTSSGRLVKRKIVTLKTC